MKKTLITLCLALGIGLMFGACQREVPNIKFENEITETSDFSGVLAAIKDQSKTLAEKLDLIKDAIYKAEGTLSEKLDLIEKAVDKGITTYKEMAQAMIASIDSLKTSQADKLQAIYDIIDESGASLSQKLADVEAALKAGFLDEKEAIDAMAEAIGAAIEAQTEAQTTAFEELKKAVDEGLVTVADATAALQKALVEEMKASTNTLADKMELLAEVTALGFEASTDMMELLKDELKKELNDDTVAITDKLKAMGLAIQAGFQLESNTIDTLRSHLLKELKDESKTLNETLELIKGAIETGFTNDSTAIVDMKEALVDALVGEKPYSISKKLDKLDSLAALRDIEIAIKAIDADFKKAFGEKFGEDLLFKLGELKTAIEAGADYSGIIDAIKSLKPTSEIKLYIGAAEITSALTAKIEGEVLDINLKTVGEWEVDEKTIPDWITLDKKYGTGDAAIKITVAKNNTKEKKTGKVTFTSGKYTTVLTIEQAAPVISINPTTKTIAATGERFTVTVTSNASWTIVETFPDWVTLADQKTVSGQTILTLNVAENGSSARNAKFTFKVNDAVSTTLTINQEKKDKGKIYTKLKGGGSSWSNSGTGVWVNVNGEHCGALVRSTQQWRATTPADWIIIPEGWQPATDNNGVEISIQVKVNDTGSEREEIITLETIGGAKKTIRIMQDIIE